MLRTIQIIALVQGLFLLLILYRDRKSYKKVPFWLFFGCILSVMLFLIGDDENNMFGVEADLFLFNSSLFITFLFLFFRYSKSKNAHFKKDDLIFFLPNLVYVAIEVFEVFSSSEIVFIEALELLVEAAFLGYLAYIIYQAFANRTKNWIFYFAIPIAILLGLGYFNDVLALLGFEELPWSSGDDFESYLLVVIAFLFYFITFNLITKPKGFFPKSARNIYQKSHLSPEMIQKCKNALNHIMVKERLFLDQKLSIHKVSEKVGIPRKYLSEVLNLHMNTNFQDFVNSHRIQEFKRLLLSEKYANYTLLGIASEVGFSSKSTFNSSFKKLEGITPNQYKKSIEQNRPIGAE